MSKYTYPTELKKLKVCLQCNLMKTNNQFHKEGCNNCRIAKEAMIDNITGKFKGMIAITDPRRSWCAKYLDKSDFYYMLETGMTSLEDLSNLFSIYYFFYVS